MQKRKRTLLKNNRILMKETPVVADDDDDAPTVEFDEDAPVVDATVEFDEEPTVEDDEDATVEDVEAVVELLVELARKDIAYEDMLYDDAPLVVQFGPNDG
jgi:hypothetical protein